MPGRVKTPFKLGRSPRSSAASIENPAEPTHNMKKAARASREFVGLERKSTSKGPPRPPPASLEAVIESPPLVFYGPPDTSTGALLSGQLKLTVNDPEVHVDSFYLDIFANVTTKKPVNSHCTDCAIKINKLHSWQFLTEPLTLKQGIYSYPFSYLLPGHLPATCNGALAKVDYSMAAKVTANSHEDIQYRRPLQVKRAITPGSEKSSLRIFPPTSLTANVGLQPVMYPIGVSPVQFRLEGVVKRNLETQTRWRLRKLNWRIDEKSKMISPACSKHNHKLGGEGKGILHEDVRTIGGEDLKNGWKTDYSTETGLIEIEFPASINSDSHPVCDVDSASGLTVSHNLVIELVVSEEYCYNKTPNLVTPTGAARILRMTFHMVMTERSGLGISWDEEQPPMYDDVPASPPTYNATIDDFDGSLTDHEEMEHLHL